MMALHHGTRMRYEPRAPLPRPTVTGGILEEGGETHVFMHFVLEILQSAITQGPLEAGSNFAVV